MPPPWQKEILARFLTIEFGNRPLKKSKIGKSLPLYYFASEFITIELFIFIDESNNYLHFYDISFVY